MFVCVLFFFSQFFDIFYNNVIDHFIFLLFNHIHTFKYIDIYLCVYIDFAAALALAVCTIFHLYLSTLCSLFI